MIEKQGATAFFRGCAIENKKKTKIIKLCSYVLNHNTTVKTAELFAFTTIFVKQERKYNVRHKRGFQAGIEPGTKEKPIRNNRF